MYHIYLHEGRTYLDNFAGRKVTRSIYMLVSRYSKIFSKHYIFLHKVALTNTVNAVNNTILLTIGNI